MIVGISDDIAKSRENKKLNSANPAKTKEKGQEKKNSNISDCK